MKDPKASKTGKIKEGQNLRRVAEAHLSTIPPISPAETESTSEETVHELRVHQVELELQNEALRESQRFLEEARDRYADLYEFAPVGYLTLTKEGIITEGNLTSTTILGAERNKLIKRRFRNFISDDNLNLWGRYFTMVVDTPEKQVCELKLIRGNGSTIIARLEAIRMDRDLKEPVIRMALSDVTDRVGAEENLALKNHDLEELNIAYRTIAAGQETLRLNVEELTRARDALQASEDELRKANVEIRDEQANEKKRFEEMAKILDAVPAAVMIAHDAHGMSISGNKVAQEWLRLPEDANMSLAAPVGERPASYRLFRGERELGLDMMPLRRAATGENVRDFEFDLVYPDGSRRNLMGNATPLFDESGNIRGSVAAFVDITRRKQAEKELKQSEAELKKTLAEKEILLSEVHHRVKNNLTAFISLLSLEGSHENTEEGKALRKDLQNRALSMALIHETLYKTGKFASVDMEIYLSTLVNQIAASYVGSAKVRTFVDACGITLDLSRATTAGLIINELVTNSFKYAFPPGFDCLTVRGEPCTVRVSITCREGSYILTVSDNGCGLPPGFDPCATKSLGLKMVTFLAHYQLRAEICTSMENGTKFVFPMKNNGDCI